MNPLNGYWILQVPRDDGSVENKQKLLSQLMLLEQWTLDLTLVS